MDLLKVIAITFTNICNLSCIHCGRDANSTSEPEKKAAFFLKALEEGRTLGAEQVNITGGEIFCRSDCFDLIQGAIDLGYFVSIESNGTLITQQSIDRLSAYGSQVRISISVDGVTAEVHDAIRGAGTFDITMATILALQKANVPTRIITVLHRQNINQIPAMVKYFVDDLGLGFRLLPNIMEYGKGVYACNTYGVEFDEAMALLNDFYFDYMKKKESDTVSLEINVALAPMDFEDCCLCPWGKSMVGIGPTGVVSLCHVSYKDERFVFGSLETNSLTEIWAKSDTLNSFRNMNPNDLKGVCGNCLAREICRGGCRLHAISKYDDFFAPDPYCQTAYNLGKFPEYALEIDNKDCSFEKGGPKC